MKRSCTGKHVFVDPDRRGAETLGDAADIREARPDSLGVRVAPPAVRQVPGAWVQRATYKSDGTPLVGRSISIRGLKALQTDVLLRVELLDGSTHSAILRPNTPSFEIPGRESKKEVALATWKMGVIHILEGFDHLFTASPSPLPRWGSCTSPPRPPKR